MKDFPQVLGDRMGWLGAAFRSALNPAYPDIARLAAVCLCRLSLCLVCVWNTQAAAQPGPPWQALVAPVFQPVTDSADLPTVLLPLEFAEDQSGFLWAAGESGLTRWDGYSFHSYSRQQTPADGLQDHYVQAMHQAEDGTFWVGTAAGGLARYDAIHDVFVAVPLRVDGGTTDRGAHEAWSIGDDGAGGLWVGTDAGLYRLSAAGHVTAHLRHDAARPGSLPDDKIQAVLCDHRGAIWVGGG